MTDGAVEERVENNLGAKGSNPDREWHFCKIFRTAKTQEHR